MQDQTIADDLATTVKGMVIGPDDTAYDEARGVVNTMIDKRPAAVVRPTGAADVIEVIQVKNQAIKVAKLIKPGTRLRT